MSEDQKTAREVQKSLFVSSIYKEMDVLAKKADDRNKRLEERTDSLMRSGCSHIECIDILVFEGFNSDLARHYVYAVCQGTIDEQDARLIESE